MLDRSHYSRVQIYISDSNTWETEAKLPVRASSKESQTSLPPVGNRRFDPSKQKIRRETIISRLDQTEVEISGLEENVEKIMKHIQISVMNR